MNRIDEKLRIRPEELTREQRAIYMANKIKCIKKLFKNMENESLKPKTEENQEDNDRILKTNESLEEYQEGNNRTSETIERLKEEYQKKYPDIGITEEQIRFIATAKALTTSPSMGVEKLESFLESGYKKLLDSSDEKTIEKLRDTKMITINLGKVKYVNDKFGHTECDELVCRIIRKIKQELQDLGLRIKNRNYCKRYFRILFVNRFKYNYRRKSSRLLCKNERT